MANAINDMERKLNENETHADPNAKTEDMCSSHHRSNRLAVAVAL